MLTIMGPSTQGFCDRVSRRNLLRIGALGVGGACFPGPLEASRSIGDRSLIMIYLPGGLTQSDTFDMKPTAPSEIRGPFQPISTAVPGLHICQLLPRLAQSMKHVALIRTVVGFMDRHESFQCYTGRPGGRPTDADPPGGWPTLGSVVSQLQGPVYQGLPAYADAGPVMTKIAYRNLGRHDGRANSSWPGFLGVAHTPFQVEGQGRSDLILNAISPDRLQHRKQLLHRFDQLRRQLETDPLRDYGDAFRKQALDLLTSNRLVNALDLSREAPRTIERYGPLRPTLPQYEAAPKSPQHLLLARRLVEAGVRVVTVAYGSWDWHGDRGETLEKMARSDLPDLDHTLATFIQDLKERGLLEKTMVIVWGEMGRTPRINIQGGRDHWPRVLSALLIGGEINGGTVLGRTDSHAALPRERPVHVQEVFATLYQHLGIDASTTTITDLNGRPRYLVDRGYGPLNELLA